MSTLDRLFFDAGVCFAFGVLLLMIITVYGVVIETFCQWKDITALMLQTVRDKALKANDKQSQ